jgi:serine/threonine-protein kinase
VYDYEQGSTNKLSSDVSSYPAWSPDGRFLVFHARGGMYWVPTDGAGTPRHLTESKAIQLPSSFSPDGKRLAYTEIISGGEGEVRTVAVESTPRELRRAGEPQVFVKTAVPSAFPAFSPDGQWLAYSNAAAGRYEVFVRAFPDNGTLAQISNSGGVIPVWSRNGELFYRTIDQRIMVSNYIVKGGRFVHQKPQVWFGKTLANVGIVRDFDLAPDGKHFVVLMPVDAQEPREAQSHVMLVTNFFDEVRRRVAAQGK